MARQGAIESLPKTPFILGFECSGVIEQVGEGVEKFKVSKKWNITLRSVSYITYWLLLYGTVIFYPDITLRVTDDDVSSNTFSIVITYQFTNLYKKWKCRDVYWIFTTITTVLYLSIKPYRFSFLIYATHMHINISICDFSYRNLLIDKYMNNETNIITFASSPTRIFYFLRRLIIIYLTLYSHHCYTNAKRACECTLREMCVWNNLA